MSFQFSHTHQHVFPKGSIFFLLWIAFAVSCFAQKNTKPTTRPSNKSIAKAKANMGMQYVDEGNLTEGLKYLKEAQQLDPQNILYAYQIGNVYYIQENYTATIETLKKLLTHKDITTQIYQLLGNSYDNTGKSIEALSTYQAGLHKFPEAGSLYMEIGMLYLLKKEYAEALLHFEKGIQVAPTYSSNYYWAAQIYFISSEKVWAMLYGELFMNLERHSERTDEMSKLLYNAYNSCITFRPDSLARITFGPKNSTSVFASQVYDSIMTIAVANETAMDLQTLNNIRTKFLNLYFQNENNNRYPNALFEYQQQVEAAGHLEAYNFWILSKGNESDYSKWHSLNGKLWDTFVKWFNQNKMLLSTDHKFYREQYK